MENRQPPTHLECEALFQKAASEYVSFHKQEVVEFYLDELSKKLNYEIKYKWLLSIISDDISMLTDTDIAKHLLSFPQKGEVFNIIRIGKQIKDDLDSFPIQYVDCEIIKVLENEYVAFRPSIIYDRRTLRYPIKPQPLDYIIIRYNELPYWYFKK